MRALRLIKGLIVSTCLVARRELREGLVTLRGSTHIELSETDLLDVSIYLILISKRRQLR